MSILTKQAEQYCEKNGHRLTEPRIHVLKILEGAAAPLTAYDVLDKLAQYLDNPKPPTAYRAIEFWQDHGFIHRIESLNAYIVCQAGHSHEGSQFMICDECGHVSEAHLCNLPDSLSKKASARKFDVSHWSVELHGKCDDCRKSV